jgi:hypothetical protein
MKLLIEQFFYPPLNYYLQGPNIFLCNLFSDTLNLDYYIKASFRTL